MAATPPQSQQEQPLPSRSPACSTEPLTSSRPLRSTPPAWKARSSNETSYTVPRGNQPPTLDSIANRTINEDAPQQTVSLTGISSGAADETQTLTVTATSGNPGLIPDPAVTYTSPNAAGSLSFTPAANANGSATITVTVNDGQPANNTFSRTFTVTVNAVNEPPTLNPLGSLTINEDSGPQTVNLSGISSGAANESQTLTVTASSSNPNLIPKPTVTYASPSAGGSIAFTPVPNAFGIATITVTVNDGQPTNNTISRSFTVIVDPINDPPTLNPLADRTVPENAGLQTVSLSGISTGATNEVQVLTVTAASSNPGLIPNPAVTYVSPAATGSLKFIPVANSTGSVTLTVTVSDGQLAISRAFAVTVQSAAGQPGNTPPVISAIPDQTISQDTATAALPFLVSDAETAASGLAVSAVSDNTVLVPSASMVLNGSDTNRTLTVTPAAGRSGYANITLFVSDGVASNSVTFGLTVQAAGGSVMVTWKGKGRVTPNLSAQTLTVGNTYSLTAVPAHGHIFCGWSGSSTSATPTISFVFQTNLAFKASFDPLTIVTNGPGTTSPNLAGSQSLVEGRTYSITAVPQAGQVFAGWTGSYTSSAPRLNFIMAEDTVLIANFIPNPFLSVKGNYSGLFYEAAGVQQYSAGFMSLAVTASGGYSGWLRLGPSRLSFSGKLDLQRSATKVVALNANTNLTLTFTVDGSAGASQLFGTITDGSWTAALSGDLSVFSAAINPCPYAGWYTLVFPGQDSDPTLPKGDGFGTLRVTTGGTALFAGTLADGAKISQSVPLSAMGAWPLFASLYSGNGTFMDWMSFENRAGDDIHGTGRLDQTADSRGHLLSRRFRRPKPGRGFHLRGARQLKHSCAQSGQRHSGLLWRQPDR